MSSQPRSNQPGDPIAQVVQRQRPGFTLEQPFYTDAEIYEREVQRFVLSDWLYVGHVSQIPAPGDYLVYDIAGESVIVVRDRDSVVRALVNVCRHRGSRLCDAAADRTQRFVCPYHGWTYALDGRLRSARWMPDDLDTSAYGLHRCAVEVFHGFIFASFAPQPASLEGLRRDLDAALAPFGLARCKVAVQRTYPVRANWKLVLENFMECYHCAPAHPEFAQSHANKLPPGSYTELEEALRARSTLVTDVIANKYPTDPAGRFIYYYDRYPLFEGYSTGSEDGKPVAPLLGDIQEFDGGASNGSYGLLCYTLVYSDHCVVYRFTPRSVAETEMDIVWLVDGDAREGADYDLDRLTWLWHVTTEADQAIIERNQRGVQSRFYQPGPYAPMERYVVGFVEWYLKVLGEPAG